MALVCLPLWITNCNTVFSFTSLGIVSIGNPIKMAVRGHETPGVLRMSRAAHTSQTNQKKWLLEMLPEQRSWSDEDYLWLTDHTTRLVELTDGVLELLPTPTDKHQSILEFLFLLFHGVLTPLGGKVHLAPLRLRLRAGKFREPDLLLLLDAKDPRRENRFWTGADLVLEVVSKDNPERDLVQKRDDYARAKIPEYWIVNPLTETILVFHLKSKKYQQSGSYPRGTRAASRILDVAVSVDEVFDAD
jgi:Uma2 family endonuclease